MSWRLANERVFFSGGCWSGCVVSAGPGILGRWLEVPVDHLLVEFVNVGGWLANGDMAWDSGAHFLAVAEHRLIRAGARSVVHLFVVDGYQGAEEDSEKLSLTDKQLSAVLAEAQVVCVGLPMLFMKNLMLILGLFLAWPRICVRAGWLT